jgi:biopolymer transport protein ExbD
MKHRESAHEEELEFQIAPMIDVLLVILIFFISITSASVLQGDRDISLPIAANAMKPSKTVNEALLNVHWEGKAGWVTVDSENFQDLKQLTTRLAARVGNSKTFRVLIRADRETPARYIQKVMGAAAGAGIGDVVFTAVNHD